MSTSAATDSHNAPPSAIAHWDRVLEVEHALAERLRRARDPNVEEARRRALPEGYPGENARVDHEAYGAFVLGPPLAAFAEWVVDEGLRLGDRTVFCLMREGHLLATLVNGAARARGVDFAAKPLWTSRYALRLASFSGPEDANVLGYFRQRHPVTLERVAEDFALPIETLEQASGFVRNERLQGARAEQVQQAIARTPALADAFMHAVHDRRRGLGVYFREVGVFDEPALTLVDVGWAGTIQRSLIGFLAAAGHEKPVRGLYLGTNEGIDALPADRASALGFLCHRGTPSFLFDPLQRTPELLENACTPRKGSLRGFDAAGASEHFPLALPAQQLDDIEALQRGILRFAAIWFARANAARDDRTVDATRIIVARSLTSPTPEEAALFAGWMHESNDGSVHAEPLLGDAALRERARTMTRRAIEKLPWSTLFWPAGLATMLGKEEVPALHERARAAVRRLRDQLSNWLGVAKAP